MTIAEGSGLAPPMSDYGAHAADCHQGDKAYCQKVNMGEMQVSCVFTHWVIFWKDGNIRNNQLLGVMWYGVVALGLECASGEGESIQDISSGWLWGTLSDPMPVG